MVTQYCENIDEDDDNDENIKFVIYKLPKSMLCYCNSVVSGNLDDVWGQMSTAFKDIWKHLVTK